MLIHIPKEKRRKFDKKAREGFFVGYDEDVKGYKVWNREERKMEYSRNIIFEDELQDDKDARLEEDTGCMTIRQTKETCQNTSMNGIDKE